MCGPCAIAERHALVRGAREFADDLLGAPRQRVSKRLQLDTPDGFDRAVAALAAALQADTGPAVERADESLRSLLQADWRRLSRDRREALIQEATREAGQALEVIAPQLKRHLGQEGLVVAEATREGLRRAHGLSLSADLDAADERALTHLARSHSLLVTDTAGRGLTRFETRARDVIARGAAAGLGRADIAAELEALIPSALIGRSAPYWEIVAGAFVAQGRSASQLGGYAQAGVERYMVEAVLDERTTEVCRFLHGKVFSVRAGLRQRDRLGALQDPREIKAVAPWVREARERSGSRRALFIERDGRRVALANIRRSGAGLRDDLGEFDALVDSDALANLGVSLPPFHGLCRSTTLPVL